MRTLTAFLLLFLLVACKKDPNTPSTPAKTYQNCSIVGFYSSSTELFTNNELYDHYLEIFSGGKLVMRSPTLKLVSAKDIYNDQIYWRLSTPIVFSNIGEEQYVGRMLYSVRSVAVSPKSGSIKYGVPSNFNWDIILFNRSHDYFLYSSGKHSLAVRYF